MKVLKMERQLIHTTLLFIQKLYLIIKKDDYEIKTINNVLENLHVNDAPNEPIKHSDETYYVIDSDKSDDYIKLE